MKREEENDVSVCAGRIVGNYFKISISIADGICYNSIRKNMDTEAADNSLFSV